MTDASEDTAQRIAQRGRDTLLMRLRPAFEEAAAKHSDVLWVDNEKLEQMVQVAADRADGLLWRRALAGAAVEQLGITLGEALSHPAVARAQELIGAPPYEEDLATTRSRSNRDMATGTAETKQATHAEKPRFTPPSEITRETQTETAAAHTARVNTPRGAASQSAEVTKAALIQTSTGTTDPETIVDPETVAEVPTADLESSASTAPKRTGKKSGETRPLRKTPNTLGLTAVHVAGVVNLQPGEANIELRISERGLDILRGADELLGRLPWPEIQAMHVPPATRLRRRRRRHAQVVVRTASGDATFEIPDVVPSELTEHLTPLVQRFGRR